MRFRAESCRDSSSVHTMPSKLLSIFFLVLFAAFTPVAPVLAANLTPISVSGFNRDIVVENTSAGPAYTTALEFNPGEGTALYQTNLSGKSHGLPLNGLFTNATDNTSFQLQPYTANNALV